MQLHDTYGRDRLEAAIQEAVRCETFHIPAVRNILARKSAEGAQPLRRQVRLAKDSKAADIVVGMGDYRDFVREMRNDDVVENEELA